MEGNLSIPPEQWLTDQFEFEWCDVCGGDAEHHTAVPLLGNWFARCDFPPDDDGNSHPAILAFRERYEGLREVRNA